MADAATSEESADSPVLTERRDAVLLITINRPTARNALNLAVAEGIAAAVDSLDTDPELAVGVLTGAAGNFSSGMDLKAFATGETPMLPGRGLCGIAEQAPAKPLIAAVEGYALAGGFEVALACDLTVASREAVFGLPEVRRGLLAAGGGLVRLPRVLPPRIAAELILTGDFFSAERMAEHGVVSRLTEPGRAVDAALELAAKIAANAPPRGRGRPPHAAALRRPGRSRAVGAPGRGDRDRPDLRGRPGGRPRLRREAPAPVARPLTRRRLLS